MHLHNRFASRRASVGSLFVAAVTSVLAVACSDSTAAKVPAALTPYGGTSIQLIVGTATPNTLGTIVSNADGVALSGVTVAWNVEQGDGTLSATTSVTDADGVATVTYTPGTKADTVMVTASVTGLTALTIEFVQVAGPANTIALVSGDGQQGVTGTALAAPLVVRVNDAYGNAVSGVTVTWTTSDDGSFSSATGTTDDSGQVSVTYTVGTAPGTKTVTAMSGTLTPVTFTVTGLSPQ